MQTKMLLALCSSLVAVSVACGGATQVDSGPGGGRDPGPGNADGNGGGGGGEDGEKGTPMPAPGCAEFTSTPVSSCAGGVAFRANAALSFKVRDNSCFSGSCSGEITSACKVSVADRTISIELTGQSCSSGVDMSEGCTADCRWVEVECKLPALAAGDYHVVGVRDQYHPTGPVLDTTLVVKDEATQSACAENADFTNP